MMRSKMNKEKSIKVKRIIKQIFSKSYTNILGCLMWKIYTWYNILYGAISSKYIQEQKAFNLCSAKCCGSFVAYFTIQEWKYQDVLCVSI